MITILEIFDMLVMTAFVGYIFSDTFSKPSLNIDPLTFKKKWIDWDAFKFAVMVVAPGLVLHELSHKFVALSFGMEATFHAAYPWLLLGLVLKLMNFGFVVFVPAFVSIVGSGTQLQFAAIALAGPAMNMLLWLGTELALKKNKIPNKHRKLAFLTKEVNKFLFIFNMIPIPGFDGSKVLSGLINTIF